MVPNCWPATISLRKCTPQTSRCSAYSDARARIAWDFSGISDASTTPMEKASVEWPLG